jgi:hypothetical protein
MLRVLRAWARGLIEGIAREIMTRRLTQLRVAAVAFGALAVVSFTGPSAHAFTMETLSTGGNSTRFADPDERSKNFGQGSQPFGPNGPTVQFNGGAGAGQGALVPPSLGGGPHGGFYGPPPPLVGGN